MNVCVVSAMPSHAARAQEVATELTGRGYRTIVVLLYPIGTRRFQVPGAVIVAPNSLDQRLKRLLNESRVKWQEPLSTKTGTAWRVARAAEWRAFRVARFAMVRTALEGESLLLRARPFLPGGDAPKLIELIPQGPSAYAIIHAADERAAIPAQAVAATGGAAYFGPDAVMTGPDYERINENWLKR